MARGGSHLVRGLQFIQTKSDRLSEFRDFDDSLIKGDCKRIKVEHTRRLNPRWDTESRSSRYCDAPGCNFRTLLRRKANEESRILWSQGNTLRRGGKRLQPRVIFVLLIFEIRRIQNVWPAVPTHHFFICVIKPPLARSFDHTPSIGSKHAYQAVLYTVAFRQ